MELRKLDSVELTGKSVLVRMDLDVEISNAQFLISNSKSGIEGVSRLELELPTLEYILGKVPRKVVVIGHKGRPHSAEAALGAGPHSAPLDGATRGRPEGELSLKLVGELIRRRLDVGEDLLDVKENLRFDKREEENDEGFARELSEGVDVCVNEAFASSHRKHASIVGVPKYVKEKCAGLRFAEEVAKLSRVLEKPERPLVSILSGVKEDKLEYLEGFKKFSDRVLVGGRLPEYVEKDDKYRAVSDEKMVVARLVQDKEDITINSIEVFEEEIGLAKTIVVAGPVGKFEEEGHRQGTERVFRAVANSSAYKLAGGGDTGQAIKVLGLEGKFDWISVGGGAMLEFLVKGTLPGIEALV